MCGGMYGQTCGKRCGLLQLHCYRQGAAVAKNARNNLFADLDHEQQFLEPRSGRWLDGSKIYHLFQKPCTWFEPSPLKFIIYFPTCQRKYNVRCGVV